MYVFNVGTYEAVKKPAQPFASLLGGTAGSGGEVKGCKQEHRGRVEQVLVA